MLLESAGVNGAYTSLGSYPDEEIYKLVAAAAAALGHPRAAILRWFGRKAMPLFAEKYPNFFATQTNTRRFLLTVNDIIHPEVRKLYPGANVPVFDFDTSSPDTLLMGYKSERKLCALAQGFVEGAADHYGEDISFEHVKCVDRGDEKCVFKISFQQRRPDDRAHRHPSLGNGAFTFGSATRARTPRSSRSGSYCRTRPPRFVRATT
jgi:hypothetical protein